MLHLKIDLGIDRYEHLKEKSVYNHNYYRLHPYGDWCILHFPILLEVCHEDENFCEYSLGDFDENGEFVEVLNWNGEFGESIEDIFK